MLKQLQKEYGYYLRITKGLAHNTITSYMSDLDEYIRFLTKNYNTSLPDTITKQHIRNFLNRLKRKEEAASSIARKISAIRSFHRFLLQEKEVDENVAFGIHLPKKDKKLPTVLSIKEIDALMVASEGDNPLEQRNRAMLELLYGSGLRVSELLNLSLNDLHINTGFIDIIGKGNKERIVPLGEESAYALKRYLEDGRQSLKKHHEPALFINSRGNKLSRVGLYKVIKTLTKKAGIMKDVSPHTLRHSFASHLLENGVDLRYVQELLGHEDVSTTQIYTHINKNQLKDVYDRYHPRSHNKEE
ncbi:MAG: site-specific tyrosine recombinase XerD [Candidatus Izemoplasma sp.]|nr:site-specific tyrosine recombinase XerD [Candidatus Izemoplasma sp.]